MGVAIAKEIVSKMLELRLTKKSSVMAIAAATGIKPLTVRGILKRHISNFPKDALTKKGPAFGYRYDVGFGVDTSQDWDYNESYQ